MVSSFEDETSKQLQELLQKGILVKDELWLHGLGMISKAQIIHGKDFCY